VRSDQYDIEVFTPQERQALDQMRNTVRGLEIVWRRLEEGCPFVGQSLVEANVRARTGASVIAIIRDQQVLPNPKSGTRFEVGDLVGLIGDTAQVAALDRLLATPAPAPPGALPGAEAQHGDIPVQSYQQQL
jgi:CPA2 family monovalent cation:H+ antiporter-2